MPLLTALLLTTVGVGIVARSAPQMNIMQIGFGLRIIIGLICLLILLELTGVGIAKMLFSMRRCLFGFLRVM